MILLTIKKNHKKKTNIIKHFVYNKKTNFFELRILLEEKSNKKYLKDKYKKKNIDILIIKWKQRYAKGKVVFFFFVFYLFNVKGCVKIGIH